MREDERVHYKKIKTRAIYFIIDLFFNMSKMTHRLRLGTDSKVLVIQTDCVS